MHERDGTGRSRRAALGADTSGGRRGTRGDVAMPYRLGLPIWAYPKWKGRYFDDEPSMLASYARVFNAVEGNTTFYGVPDPATVTGWRRALDGTDFRFSFKLPRSVTHERSPDAADLERFLGAIRPLGEHLGPLLVQFAERAGPAELAAFEPLFERLAEIHRCVVEVRHPAFFAEPGLLEPMLERYRFGRVMLDTRALYRGDLAHPDVAGAAHRKPDVPLLDEVYAGLAFARVVLHPDGLDNDRWIDDWVERAARMIGRGDEAHVMVHCPNNLYCTEFARTFHERLRVRLGRSVVPELPPWPVPQQESLF